MVTNPYASFLGNQDPLAVISSTPDRLAHLFEKLGSERADVSPAPGKWSARQVLIHLADTEIAFAFRIRQALAEDHHVIQPFDQERWAESWPAYPLPLALETFRALRAYNVAMISSVLPAAAHKPLRHPERGDMTFQALVETMGGHDLNHLGQIENMAA